MRCTNPTLVSALLTLVVLVPSAVAKGAPPAAYLKLLAGARPLGMGGAFTAVANDVTANLYNAAALSEIASREAIFQHANLSLDRKFNYLAFAWPHHKDVRGYGFSYTRFNVDGIPETRANADGTPIVDGTGRVIIFSLFDDIEEAVTVSHAFRARDNIRLGITGRVLRQKLFNQTATGLGADVSALYQPTNDVRLGLRLGDLFETLRWRSGHKDKVPFTATGGAAVRGWQDITYAVDVQYAEADDLTLRVGAEKWWQNHYAARVGFNDGDFTIGAGVRFRAFQADYAFQNQELGDINRISLLYRW